MGGGHLQTQETLSSGIIVRSYILLLFNKDSGLEALLLCSYINQLCYDMLCHAIDVVARVWGRTDGQTAMHNAVVTWL